MNDIVGSSALGYGFNALGPYDPSSLMSRAFTQSYNQHNTYTYQPTGIEYSVPDNASVVPYNPAKGGTQVFQSQYDLQSYLAISADISASYGAFSGQISASYENALQEWGSCYYALTNAWIANWMVVLQDVTADALVPSFRNVLNNLPTTFGPMTEQTFFQFFRQYGTHFVHSVGAGGFFAYYEAVENNGSYSQTQVQANVALEYQAVFLDASAKSQADWQQLGQQWSQSRIVTISALGGNAQTLNDISPTFDTSASSSYTSWLQSIEANPATVQFILRGWDELLPSDSPQQLALQQALHAYMNFNLYVSAIYDGNASTGRPRVVVQGVDVLPSISWPANSQTTYQGIEIVLVDNKTLAVTFSGVYHFDANADNGTQLFNQLLSDLGTHGSTANQWCCCSVFNYPWGVLPPQNFITWLNTFGISAQKWLDNYYNCGGGQASLNYVALGLSGGLGVQETFSFNNFGYTTVNELNVNPYVLETTLVAAERAEVASPADGE